MVHPGKLCTSSAIAPRVGDRVRGFDASVYAEYCLGGPVPVQEVISRVRLHLEDQPPNESDLARHALYTVLRANYPCVE